MSHCRGCSQYATSHSLAQPRPETCARQSTLPTVGETHAVEIKRHVPSCFCTHI